MATSNTELNVTFKLINQEFNAKLREVNSSMKELRSEFALNASQFKMTGDKGTYLENKLSTLRSQESLLKDKVQEAEKALEETVAVYGENSKEAEAMRTKLNYAKKEFNDCGSKIRQAEEELKAFNNQAELIRLDKKIAEIQSQMKGLKIGQAFQDAGKKIQEAGNKVKDFGDKITSAGKTLSTKITAPLAALGIASVKTGADFDESMSQVAATMGTTTDKITDLRDFAIEMGSKTSFSAKQAAEGLNYMALAGYDAGTSMKMLPIVLDLAAAGNMDLAKASDMVTDAQTALGLSTDGTVKLVDQMAKTASTTNTSVSQLGQAYLTVGGTAKMMKGGTTELSQVLGLLADNGIKGSEGGTALRNMLLSLSAPTDKAATVLNALGVEVFDANGNMKSMQDIMGQLNKAMEGMTQEDKTQAIANIFNKRDLKSVNALLGTSSDRWNEVAGAIDNAEGSASQMAETQLDNLNGSLKILKSALEGAAIAIGDVVAPYVRKFADLLTDLVTKFNNLSPSVKRVIVVFGAIVAAIGPVVMIIGTVVSAIGTVMSVVGGIVSAIGTAIVFVTNMGGVLATLSAGLQVVIGVVGAVATSFAAIPIAIAAVVVILVTMYKKCEWFRNGVNSAFNAVKNTFTTFVSTAKNAFDKVKTTITNAWNKIKATVSTAVNNIKTTISNTFNAIKTTASNVWAKIKSVISTPINAVKTTISKVVSNIKSAMSFSGLSGTVGKVFSTIKSKITDPITKAKEKISSIIKTIKGYFPFKLGKILTLKLPKISVTGGKAPWGIGGKGSLPKFSVTWNKKAMDNPYMFEKATLFGAGEAGDEVLYGRRNLLKDIGDVVSSKMSANIGDMSNTQNITVNVYGAEGQNVKELANEVEKRLIQSANRRRLSWQ